MGSNWGFCLATAVCNNYWPNSIDEYILFNKIKNTGYVYVVHLGNTCSSNYIS